MAARIFLVYLSQYLPYDFFEEKTNDIAIFYVVFSIANFVLWNWHPIVHKNIEELGVTLFMFVLTQIFLGDIIISSLK